MEELGSSQSISKTSFDLPQQGPAVLDEFPNTLDSLNSSKLQRQESPDVKNSKDQNSPHLAAEHKSKESLGANEKSTYNVNAVDGKGNNILHSLLSSNHEDYHDDLVKFVRIFLEKGANVKLKNVEGKTPLHSAMEYGSVEVTKLLLEYGADPKSCDNRGSGVLHYLANSPNNSTTCAKLLELLLNAGCDVNAINLHERTPLHNAFFNRHDVCFDLLIEHGANIKHRIKFGMTILHVAVKYAKQHVIEKLMRILNEGDPCEKDAMINAKRSNGMTALHLTTRQKSTSILNLLLQNGADVGSTDFYGRTALHYACKYNNVNVFDELMNFGADVNAKDNKGMTPVKLLNQKVEAVIWLRVMKRNVKCIGVGLPAVDFCENIIQVMNETNSHENYNVEINQMKETSINSIVSVYDLLMNERKMYKYRNNVALKEIIMNSELFPTFREILIGKYRRAGMRRSLVGLASKAMCKMTDSTLPDELSEMIFEKLTNAELHDFIEAAVIDDQD